ncbi:hypothetical protein ACFQJ7_12140 [Halovenus rubra]|uniref:Uncharacterized protein n=2 Tax=Halovenus rubra TaxID=869890 RepID=A0ABD5XA70_9EURY|nr:hypothetical protein [Halovenus rubra]
MGIVESALSEFELSDGTEYTVEYNEGDIIHIHAGPLRIECSEKEFQEFADATEDALLQLREEKNL